MKRGQTLRNMVAAVEKSVNAEIARAAEDAALRALKRAAISDRQRVIILAQVTGRNLKITHFHQAANKAEARHTPPPPQS